jgi:hypothetical protein
MCIVNLLSSANTKTYGMILRDFSAKVTPSWHMFLAATSRETPVTV